jgi:hypothetical protein
VGLKVFERSGGIPPFGDAVLAPCIYFKTQGIEQREEVLNISQTYIFAGEAEDLSNMFWDTRDVP